MKRRDVLTGAVKLGALVSLSAAPFIMSRRARAGTTITYVGWGGSAAEAAKKYMFAPFTAETGISIDVAVGPDLARAKAQVENHQVLWDIYEGSDYAGEKQGLWEPIDWKIIDPARFIQEQPSWGVWTASVVGGIGYDPKRTQNPPKDFTQFWDVKNFPGRRALRNRVSENLEMALIADGVAPDKLYPLNVDRAFKSLDRIKPYVKKWFTATAEGVSLIQTNEVDYTYTYANRVEAAREAGVSVDLSLDQNILLPIYSSVLKGSSHKEEAMRYLEFSSRPEQQIAYANAVGGTACTVKGVNEQLNEQARRWVPDLKSPKMVFYNSQYWGDHQVELTKRFNEWLIT